MEIIYKILVYMANNSSATVQKLTFFIYHEILLK